MPRTQEKWFPEIPDDTFKNFTLEVQARGPPVDCICNRESVKILCSGCSEIYLSRISRQCVRHPNVIFLHDMTKCPKCVENPKAQLIEIDEELFNKIVQK